MLYEHPDAPFQNAEGKPRLHSALFPYGLWENTTAAVVLTITNTTTGLFPLGNRRRKKSGNEQTRVTTCFTLCFFDCDTMGGKKIEIWQTNWSAVIAGPFRTISVVFSSNVWQPYVCNLYLLDSSIFLDRRACCLLLI